MDYRLNVHDSLSHIEKNLENKISLDELARRAYLSKYHYHRLFHKITGEPLTQYIRKRRMRKAAEALAQTDRPIIEIALAYQYGSQESFSRAFQKMYGVTPGKYRKLHAQSRCGHIVKFPVSGRAMDMAA